jgi:3-hydroxybutyryl-CoA dehydrogenase
MKDIRRTTVVGAGTMGHGFAQVFALKGLPVYLVDETEAFLDRARGWILDNLNFMVALKAIRKGQIKSALARIHFTTDFKRAVENADYVLEAVPENLELKKTLFHQLGESTPPDTILATNTSSFDINEFSDVANHPARVIGTHWYHPPHITPCVEVIPSTVTSQATIEATLNFMKRIGKVPTRCQSGPGFVGNRIQFAMAAEAFAIVEEGLATPEEIDQIVKTSFGFRLGAYGPFQICDQAGADVYYAIYEYLHKKLKRDQFKPPQVLNQLIRKGHLGLKTQKGFYNYKEKTADMIRRERDRKLYNRLRLLRKEQEV